MSDLETLRDAFSQVIEWLDARRALCDADSDDAYFQTKVLLLAILDGKKLPHPTCFTPSDCAGKPSCPNRNPCGTNPA